MIATRSLMIRTGMCALLSLAMVQRSAAQEAAQPVVYASYYECDPTRLAHVDSLVRSFWTPLMDSHVAAKHALAWGWLAHHTGGTWSRAFYIVAPDVDNAVTVTEALVADARRANAAAMNETSAACPVHEDYIWQRVTGSQAVTDFARARPPASLSIYYQCDPSREQRTDALITANFAPTLNALVQAGDLNAWSWQQHLVGGKYRRMLVTEGRDAKTLLGAVGKLTQDLRTKQAAAFGEFSQICSSHQDAIWNVVVSKP